MNLDENHFLLLQMSRKTTISALFWAGLGGMQKQALYLGMTQSAGSLLEGMKVFFS